jgi:hypothetical protein
MTEPALATLVADELALAVDPRVTAMAGAIAARYGAAARAVLFYGSCLRSRELHGQMLDFYLIVSDYGAAYGRSWKASANRLIPPNVFPFAHEGLVAKYAVLSEADFFRLNGPDGLSVSVWARFAQPSRLVWWSGEPAVQHVVRAVARAAPTLLAAARPMIVPDRLDDPLELWREAFRLTYRSELRAERGGRAASVVDADPERYRRFTGPTLEAAAIGRLHPDETALLEEVSERTRSQARKLWTRRARTGKALTLLRLAKASGTYAGGIDYLAWKINRHAGTSFEIKPWQRRWPLLGALTLLPRLLKRGAIG